MTGNATPAPSAAAPPSRLERIRAPVRGRLSGVDAEIRRIVLSDFDMIAEVNDALDRMQGKLFRPTLLLLVNEAGGNPHEDAISLAAVVELVHLATLVHDDAVDHSVLRRGLPTVNHLWSHQVAIIAGDYLYTRAMVELGRIGRIEPIRALARAANAMTVGEFRQLTSRDALDFGEEDYTNLIAAKTASLMSAACEIGALVGAEEYREDFRAFGHALGMAFQVADDLLDYEGKEELTGKPTGHDLRERKVTLPLIHAFREGDEAEREVIRDFFTLAEPDDEQISRVISIVAGRGGLEYARAEARRYATSAEDALARAGGDSRALDALRAAIDYAVERRR
ncbi:MAG: polyprenyl synthetase family protein [Gemmatimonadales bacterium]|nr:MAG: polyprenyl synthetase family protein [Gemmatimonadales bacterium]